MGRDIRWAVGVTTTVERKDDMLPRMLASIKAAGFAVDRLFADGAANADGWVNPLFNGLEATFHFPQIGAYGNWILGLGELFIRHPVCHFYAMFQDDILLLRNLRQYLDGALAGKKEAKEYWNLYTREYGISKHCQPVPPGRAAFRGFYPSNQLGKGACGLVFNRKGVTDLLHSQHMALRVISADRGKRYIDGGVVEALVPQKGYTEMVHAPSLVQHIGEQSTVGNNWQAPGGYSPSFPGDDFDALSFLKS